MKNKVIVTGGAGFIGSHLVLQLLENGNKVVVIDNMTTGKQKNLELFKNDVEFLQIDINDTEKITKAFKDARCAYHVAAIPAVPKSIEDPLLTNRANIDGTVSVLVAAKDAGVQRVIFSSSASVYGNSGKLPKTEDTCPEPLTPYAIQKLAGEHYMQSFARFLNVETVSLRYFNVFGPRQDAQSSYSTVIPLFISTLLSGGVPEIHGDGTMTRDFIYVQDVVDANILAAQTEKASGVYNIASGKPISINELFETIAKLLKTEIRPTHGLSRVGDIKDSYADISKVKTELGFEPKVSLEEGIRRTIESHAHE